MGCLGIFFVLLAASVVLANPSLNVALVVRNDAVLNIESSPGDKAFKERLEAKNFTVALVSDLDIRRRGTMQLLNSQAAIFFTRSMFPYHIADRFTSCPAQIYTWNYEAGPLLFGFSTRELPGTSLKPIKSDPLLAGLPSAAQLYNETGDICCAASESGNAHVLMEGPDSDNRACYFYFNVGDIVAYGLRTHARRGVLPTVEWATAARPSPDYLDVFLDQLAHHSCLPPGDPSHEHGGPGTCTANVYMSGETCRRGCIDGYTLTEGDFLLCNDTVFVGGGNERCEVVPCGDGASGAPPDCSCDAGYIGPPVWAEDHWLPCPLAPCPAGATDNCTVCDGVGYRGTSIWNMSSSTWTPCEVVLCGVGSLGVPPNCSACNAPGYAGRSNWTGTAWTDCQTCPPGCASCSDAASCDACADDLASPEGGVCVCRTGHYLDGGQCAPCDEACLGCTGEGPGACIECHPEFAPEDGVCERTVSATVVAVAVSAAVAGSCAIIAAAAAVAFCILGSATGVALKGMAGGERVRLVRGADGVWVEQVADDTVTVRYDQSKHDEWTVKLFDARSSKDCGSAATDALASCTSLQSLSSTTALALDVSAVLSDDTTTVVGQGGSGAVFKATVEGGKQVAVKVLQDRSEEGVSEFRNEALAMAALDGVSTVVPLLQFCTRTPAIVMPFYAGGSLADSQGSRAFSNPKDLFGLSARLVEAVKTLHSHRVAHLDIKPANVIFGPDGELRLADFGTAIVDAPAAVAVPFAGTLQYASPERFSTGKWDPYAADMWSVAVTIWALAARRNPFAGVKMLTAVIPTYATASAPLIQALVRRHLPPGRVPAVRGLREHVVACMDVDATKRATAVGVLATMSPQVKELELESAV